MVQPRFFEVDERLVWLSTLGDPLQAFSRAVDFEQFRSHLEQALAYANGTKGGRHRTNF
jgi:transposase, IS5 family